MNGYVGCQRLNRPKTINPDEHTNLGPKIFFLIYVPTPYGPVTVVCSIFFVHFKRYRYRLYGTGTERTAPISEKNNLSPLILGSVYCSPDEVVGWWRGTTFWVKCRWWRLLLRREILILVPEEAAAGSIGGGGGGGGRSSAAAAAAAAVEGSWRLPGQPGGEGGDERLQLNIADLLPTRGLNCRRVSSPAKRYLKLKIVNN